MRQITLDEFRQKQEEIEKELGLRCLKSDTDQKQVELMQNLTKNTQLITDLKNEFEKNRQRVEAKLEDLADKGRGRTESIMKL